jgi:hypothetical protein
MSTRPRRSLFARSVIAYTRALVFVLGVTGAVALCMPGAPSGATLGSVYVPAGALLGGALIIVASIGLTLVVEYVLTGSAKARPVRDRQRSAGAPTA